MCDACREYGRAWRKEHPEKRREYKRKCRSENPEYKSEYRRRYYWANPEKERVGAREWNKAHAEERQEYMLKWREENKEHVQQYRRQYREANLEYQREQVRRWQKENPERCAIYNPNRRVRIEGNGGVLPVNAEKVLFEQQNGLCYLCGDLLYGRLNDPLSIEHKVPVSRGGSNDTSNVGLAHLSCNLRKSTKTPEEFLRVTHG